MNPETLTEKVQEAIVTAQHLAEQNRNTQLEPEHLLLALINQDGGVVPALLARLGVSSTTIAQQIGAAIARLARSSGPSKVYSSPRFRAILEAAHGESQRLKDDYISTEHVLLALADDAEAGPAGQILRQHGITRDRIYSALQEVRGGQRVTSSYT